MQLISKEQDSKKFIFVDCEGLDEVHELSLLSELKNSLPCEITFFGTRFLSAHIIVALKNYRGGLSLLCSDRKLWLYLNRLGFKAKFFHTKGANKANKVEAVVLGGSAGSIDTIMKILDGLPVADITIFVVVHLQKNTPSMLDKLLQLHTRYKAKFAENNEEVQKGVIYIAPPGFHLTVQAGFCHLKDTKDVNYAKPSIEITFDSLGLEYQEELVAVVLSGYGKDGVKSLQNLKDENAFVIVEDPAGVEADQLLLNAIKTKNYDLQLNISEIKSFLASKISNSTIIQQDEFCRFLEEIKRVYGYDLLDYDIALLIRRTKIAMDRASETDFGRYGQMVLSESGLFEQLLADYSINVSTFFRNPAVFAYLKTSMFPNLDTYPYIKIWSAGCSSGEEPYTVAIMLHEAGMLKKSLIYASDFNHQIVSQAKNGIYSMEQYEQFRQHYQTYGGVGDFADYFDFFDTFVMLKQLIRSKVFFFHHDLVVDGVFNMFNLIMCRNVLIYFSEGLRQKAISFFSSSLEMNGYLLLGEGEYIKNGAFECENSEFRMFKKAVL